MTLLRKGRISIPDGVMVRQLEGESVLLNLNSESYFGLDDVGTRMWTVLTESESIETAFQTLLAEYEVEPEQLRTDLCSFIDKLSVAGLIDVTEI
jgi:coenzyme PQQ synthesis protein D (PqqD)